MNKHAIILATMAVLAVAALGYFAFVTMRASSLADILLRRGWQARGWTLSRATGLLRVIGVVGAVLSAAALVVALWKLFS